MAAAIAETAPAGAPAKPGKLGKLGKRKKLIVIVVAALVFVLVGGGGTVVYLKKKAAAALAAEGDEEGGGAETAAVAAPGHEKTPPAWLPLDPFIVNLADRDADRYAQIGITLELDSGGSAEQIRAYMPAVRNAILMILASKTSKDLADRVGKEQLADEIMREAVRPMGIEIAAPQKVLEAPAPAASEVAAKASGAAAKASDAAAKTSDAAADAKAKKRARLALQRNPIQRVHFSSFIVQ